MRNYCNYLKSKKYATNSDFTFKAFLKLKKFLLIFFLNILLNSCCTPDLRPCDGYTFFPSKSYDFLIKADDFLKVENELQFNFHYGFIEEGPSRPPIVSCGSLCKIVIFSLYYTKNQTTIKIDSKNRPNIKKIFFLDSSNKFIIEKQILSEDLKKIYLEIETLPYELKGDVVIEIETEKGVFKYVKQRNQKDYLKEYYQKIELKT